jgi:hypothetical protein
MVGSFLDLRIPLAGFESDAWEFTVTQSSEYDGPASFGGYSGGGLWQNLLGRDRDGQIHLIKTVLSGVAYYQSGFQNGYNFIHCNGCDYIYGFAKDALGG